MIRSQTRADRGQAYTLEGFISAMVVLMAILFALQAVVVTPTTGGLADRTVEAQIQQEARDALVVSSGDPGGGAKMNLSETIRYWDEDEKEYYEQDPQTGDAYYNKTNKSEFYHNTTIGNVLKERFEERGLSYNVELVYWNKSAGEYESTYLVYSGESEAVVASYKVTLFEDDPLTEPDSDKSIADVDSYPIARGTDSSSAIYNVVEVRISVW